MHIFLVGLLSIVVQVILLRELSAAFYGVDLIYLLALGAWLLWTAVGALAGRGALQPPAARVALVLLAIGLVVPLDVGLVRRLRLLLGGVPGAYLSLPAQLAACILCLLPASVLLGVLFQWTAKRYMNGGRRSLARAYAIESVGGVVGGLTATMTLHWRVPNVTLAVAAAGVSFAAAAITRPPSGVRSPEPRLRSSTWRTAALAGLLLCLVAGWYAGRLDRWMTSWNHPDEIASVDSPYGRVTLAARAGQVIAYENDALAFDSEATDAEEFAHVGLLQHANPRRVLVVGGAMSGLLGEIARHRPERIDDVELDAGAVDLLAGHVPALKQSLALPGVHLVFDDPRRAIAACGADARSNLASTGRARAGTLDCGNGYDVIVVAAAEPSSAQANRLFTREFFQLCAATLSPGGVISFRLASIENLWTAPLVARTASIYVALREVFADVVVLPGGTNIVLASASPLARDPQLLAGRLDERTIHARLVTARYLRYLYANDRFAEIDSLLSRSRARPNTDANPASYQATSIFWLSKFVPALGTVDLSSVAVSYGWSAPRAWLLLALGCGLAVFWRWRRWPRRLALVGVAAFCGMSLEVLLLLHYQLKHGVVFQDLGLLLMSVMAGLAAGAWIVDRNARSIETSPGPFLGMLVVLALAVSVSISTGHGASFVSVAALLAATGAAVAGVFARASVAARPTSPTWPTRPTSPVDQRALVSPLYAADVLGGCLGSIAASLLLVPLLGLPLTAQWIAAVGIVGVLLAV